MSEQISHWRRAGILLLLLAGYYVLGYTYHLYLGSSAGPGAYRAWDLLHVLAGVVVWPAVLVLLLFRWLGPGRRPRWEAGDFLVFLLGMGFLVFAADAISYWVQETRLGLSRGVASALYAVSMNAMWPLAAIAVAVVAYQVYHMWTRRNALQLDPER